MTHRTLLDKLANKYLVSSIEDDVARLTHSAQSGVEHGWVDDPLTYLLSKLYLRWDCLLKDSNTPSVDKQNAELVLAIVLHRYGFADPALTAAAIQALDNMNSSGSLHSDLSKKTNAIKNFLNSRPVPLKQLPPLPESITFFRQGDVISVQLEQKYYAAYVHSVRPGNESPVIEFYDGSFDAQPKYKDIEAKAGSFKKTHSYSDLHDRHLSRFAVCGKVYLPDFANQIHLVKSCVTKKPSMVAEDTPNNQLAETFSTEDLFSLQLQIRLFANKGTNE